MSNDNCFSFVIACLSIGNKSSLSHAPHHGCVSDPVDQVNV
ncbi:MAG: hypothetical protein ABI340_04560 [Nitrososphaera sp.]